jgi:hypothetical protein
MFNKLPKKRVFDPTNPFRRRSTAKSIAGKLYEVAMENKYESRHGRRPEFRPSSFPLCSVLTFTRLQEGASRGYFKEKITASGDFFSGVGTYAHENIQHHIGYSGQIFGDWKCRNKECRHGKRAMDLFNEDAKLIRKGKLTRKNSTNNRCPCCAEGMEYIEKEIRYKGLKGHIDCIIKLPNGTYWVADYKTCTKNKMDSGKVPMKGHLKQLPSYCYVLKKKYHLNVVGFSLIYFSRDNPFNMFEYSEKWTEKWDEKCRILIKGERRKFKAGVKSFADQNPAAAIKHKPCTSLRFYEKEIAYYNPCPMLEVCFNETKLRKKLADHMTEFPSKESDRAKLIEAINV